MTTWLMSLDLSDIWDDAEEDYGGFFQELLKRIKSLEFPTDEVQHPYWDQEIKAQVFDSLHDIVEHIDLIRVELNEDPEKEQELLAEFRVVWHQFYDWCDTAIRSRDCKLCWVNTDI